MLIVRFSLGDRAFGVRARDVREILPLVTMRPVSGVPDHVAGELILDGAPVPVIDLRRWVESTPTRAVLGSRLLLLDWPLPGRAGAVAFLAEQVHDALDVPRSAVVPRTAGEPGERVLGGSFVDAGRIIQLLDPAALLTTDLADTLYPDAAP